MPGHELNTLLRKVDWRFLLRNPGVPRALDLSSGAVSEALALIAEPAPTGHGEADLAVLDFPTPETLEQARSALRGDGELACRLASPTPLRLRRARARLERAGFVDVSFHWPARGPLGQPKLWLPLHQPDAIRCYLTREETRGVQTALRWLWRAGMRLGVATPVWALARVTPQTDAAPPTPPDALERQLPSRPAWVLSTGGGEAANKVIGIPLNEDGRSDLILKFSRVDDSDIGLGREVEMLTQLARERPDLTGLPRVLATGERSGHRALAQSAVHGSTLSAIVTPANFAEHASRATDWLAALGDGAKARSRSARSESLISRPIDEFEHWFGRHLRPGGVERARRILSDLDELPIVCEHRDFSPWNTVLTPRRELGVLDWEASEPHGLPGLDLVYFLFTTRLVAEGILMQNGVPRNYTDDPQPVFECHRRLVDPSTELGRIVQRCEAEYCQRLDLEVAIFDRLRLLTWIVQAVDYFSPLKLEAPRERRPDPFHTGNFIELAELEIERLDQA